MIHTLKPVRLKTGQHMCIQLMSDLHFGADSTDEARILAELKKARETNARILIAGDVFDAIFLGDPRYTTSVLAKKFRGTDAPMNAVLDHAVDVLRPYADLIDLIGVGNHETKVLEKSGYDMVDLLIERLCVGTKHCIAHGGYTGAVRVPMCPANEKRTGSSSNYLIFYHHGWSGAPGQSKGVLDFNKIRIEGADCIWLAHRHSRTATPESVIYLPVRGDMPLQRQVLNVRTGSYAKPQWKQTQDGKYQAKWSRQNAMDLMPESPGGARLKIGLSSGRSTATLEMLIA